MANKPQKELGGPRQMSKGTKIVIGVFAVIMALSMTLPSLAPIFANDSNDDTQEQEQEAQTEDKDEAAEGESTDDAESDEAADTDNASESGESTTDEAKDDAAAGVPDNETLKNLADENADEVKKFEDRLEKDPNNLAALLNLGQIYMNWGYSAQYSSTTDEERDYSKGLLNKSVEYFDRYLAIEESDAVKVQRLSSLYYLGETQESLDAMKKITEENPDYPLAWAHLGLFYEWQYDQANALDAYKKAAETDPKDEYGVKSFADEHVKSINQSTSNFSDLTNEELLGTDSKPQAGLPGVIANESGI
jgi:tetratricopeptide (TPR) repeat protein